MVPKILKLFTTESNSEASHEIVVGFSNAATLTEQYEMAIRYAAWMLETEDNHTLNKLLSEGTNLDDLHAMLVGSKRSTRRNLKKRQAHTEAQLNEIRSKVKYRVGNDLRKPDGLTATEASSLCTAPPSNAISLLNMILVGIGTTSTLIHECLTTHRSWKIDYDCQKIMDKIKEMGGVNKEAFPIYVTSPFGSDSSLTEEGQEILEILENCVNWDSELSAIQRMLPDNQRRGSDSHIRVHDLIAFSNDYDIGRTLVVTKHTVVLQILARNTNDLDVLQKLQYHKNFYVRISVTMNPGYHKLNSTRNLRSRLLMRSTNRSDQEW